MVSDPQSSESRDSISGISVGAPGRGRRRLTEIFLRGVSGRRPAVPVAGQALAAQARRVMSPEAWAYIAGSAGAERTAAANQDAFDARQIRPRMLVGSPRSDLSVELFGETLSSPLLLCPVGVLEMVHPQADLAVARAASRLGVPMIFSNQASVSMETCARAMGSTPRFFQLYWNTSDRVIESFVQRAERCGCRGIVLTLDTTQLGWRPRDLNLAFLPFLKGQGIAQYTSDPVFRNLLNEPLPAPPGPSPRPTPSALLTALQQILRFPGSWSEKLSGKPRRAVQRFIATYSRPTLCWDDLPRLRAMTRLPILLKGIQHPDDARKALDFGVDGIVVSNHGGRQVDGAVGSFATLPGIVDAVNGAVPVLFDSGVRTGAHVFKALAEGATAVCLGRPFVYGLALAGERGVAEVIENLLAELDLTMALAGCRNLNEVTRDCLVSVSVSGFSRVPSTAQ